MSWYKKTGTSAKDGESSSMSKEVTLSQVYSHIPILQNALQKISSTIKYEKAGIIENDCVLQKQDRIHIAQHNIIIGLLIESHISLQTLLNSNSVTYLEKIQSVSKQLTEYIIAAQDINNLFIKNLNDKIEFVRDRLRESEQNIKEHIEVQNKDLIKGINYSGELVLQKIETLIERINKAGEKVAEKKNSTGIEDCCHDLKQLLQELQQSIQKNTQDTQHIIVGATSETEVQIKEIKELIEHLQKVRQAQSTGKTSDFIEELVPSISNKFILFKDRP